MDIFLLICLAALGVWLFRDYRRMIYNRRQEEIAWKKNNDYHIKTAEADKEYWEKFEELLAGAISLVVEIGSKCLKDDVEAWLMIFNVSEELRWNHLVTGGIWSETYLALMEKFKARIPDDAFIQLEAVNRSVAAASIDGYMRDRESLYLCEDRRRGAIEKIERAMRKLEGMSREIESIG